MTEPWTDAERIEFLGGQVLALMHMVGVLMKANPDHSALQKHYALVKQIGLAKVEGQPVPDVYLEGMQEVYSQIEKMLKIEPEQH